MKFVARQVDGKWYLAIAYGRLIRGDYRVRHGEIVFPSAYKARLCAEKLNWTVLWNYNAIMRDDNTLRRQRDVVPELLISTTTDIINEFMGDNGHTTT